MYVISLALCGVTDGLKFEARAAPWPVRVRSAARPRHNHAVADITRGPRAACVCK
jgi:hypothetical protein